MRRLSAFILLIPFAILFIGSANLSSVCTSVCPSPKPEAASCCQKEKAPCSKAPSGSKEHSCPKDQKTGCQACCFDCPLCALITVPPYIHFEPARPESTTEYAVRPDNLISDYFQHHWKPPDLSALS